MPRPRTVGPTPAEMEILQVLWERGPSTVRDVVDVLEKRKKVAYTSVATIMRIADQKGFVRIIDAKRPQRFEAVLSQSKAQRVMTDEWLKRMFNNSVVDLVAHALVGRKLKRSDVEELQKLITLHSK